MIATEVPAGPALDAQIAERVMGWTLVSGVAHYDGMAMPWTVGHDAAGRSHNIPPYSTDIAAAWALVEHLECQTVGWSVDVFRTYSHDLGELVWLVSFTARDSTYRPVGGYVSAEAPTVPLAICRAALAAGGG